MKKSTRIWVLCGLITAAVVGLLVWWTESPVAKENDPALVASSGSEDRTEGTRDSSAQSRVISADPGEDSPLETGASAVREKLLGLLADIRAGASPQEVRQALRKAKTTVHAAPLDVSAGAIIALLESGEDAPTGLDFVVGPEGVMDESPTWRTSLLDLLGQTDPFQFVPYMRTLLASATSSDEYALALRNLGWANSGGRLDGEIRGYFSAMLSRPEWRQSPSTGYLEAFDLAVATGAVGEVAAALDPAQGKTESSVSRAAFVALDRIMLKNPASVVTRFEANPDFLSRSPYHRASILSRLDVRQPGQSALLARYLLRSDHAAGELEYFTELFPNGNRFASHRLVTNPEGRGGIGDMNSLDEATTAALRGWMDTPEFAGRRGELEKIVGRLEDLSGAGTD